MAPEVDDTNIPKTNRVDIWSLGCILYRMVAGSLLFDGAREVWKYADSASSPPLAVRNRGFSIACEDFLRDVLQPRPGDRPRAEDCLTKPWIINNASGSKYSIGSNLYSRLTKLERVAPRPEPPADAAVSLAVGVHYAPVRESPAWKLNCKIGSGAFGTVFLEKVQTREMGSPELWAVKRLSRTVPNFPAKQYQSEVKNLQTLSNVSFVKTCALS